MNPFEMVVLIVLISAIAGVLRARYGVARPRRRQGGYAGHDDGESDRLRGEVRQLKDRIAVLERIVTDGDHNRSVALEREIEALRADREIGR